MRAALALRTREECENLARLALSAVDAVSARAAVAARTTSTSPAPERVLVGG